MTGRSTTRTGLERLKRDAHKYSAVIIASVDRLGRDTSANAKILADLLSLGLEVHTTDYGLIDLSNDAALIQYTTGTLFAHLERNRIVQRTKAAHIALAKRGLLPLGISAFGYTSADNKAVIVPEEARVIRQIFQWSAEGVSFLGIQNRLNEEGVIVARPSTSKTGLWGKTTIANMIRNPTYKGEYSWSYQGKTYPLAVPPIVTPELWARAQKRSRGRYSTTGWPLVGHLRCGICGRRMQSKRKRRGGKVVWESYRCQSSSMPMGACGMKYVNRQKLEAAVEPALRAALSDPEMVRRMLSTIDTRPDTTQTELAELKEEDARWLEAFQHGAISAAELGKYRSDIVKRTRELLENQQEREYPVERFVEMARALPFAELLEASGAVAIVDKDLTVTVVLE